MQIVLTLDVDPTGGVSLAGVSPEGEAEAWLYRVNDGVASINVKVPVPTPASAGWVDGT